MDDLLKDLQKQLSKINEQIEEEEKRVPAHSPKPVVMNRLFELEDQQDQLLKRIDKLKADGAD